MGSLFALFCQRLALVLGFWQATLSALAAPFPPPQVGMVWPTPAPTPTEVLRLPSPHPSGGESSPPPVVPHAVPVVPLVAPHISNSPAAFPPLHPATFTVHKRRSDVDAHLSGTLDVTTLPSGVTLWLDGVYLGATPLLLGALPPGHHVVTLTKTGWKTQEFSLELDPGATLVTSRQMRPLEAGKGLRHLGAVVIHGMVEPGTLKIDGVEVHIRPNATLSLGAGRHTVSASIAGHALTRVFTTMPDTVAMLVLDARPIDSYVALVAPLESALPRSVLSIVHRKIFIRYHGHVAVGYLQDPILRIDGKRVTLNPPPVIIGQSLYLPVTILDRLRHLRRAH